MRVLMIGTGSIGRRHMASLRQIDPSIEFDVLREPGRGTDLAGIGPATLSRSIAEALDKRPGLMVVASPSAMHLRHVLAAIDSGTPFYIEKPVVVSADDLAVLEARVARGGLPTNMVGCNLRHLPSLQTLREIVDGGRLGRIARADFEAGQWLPDWRPTQDYRQSYSASRAMGGGVVFDLIHEIDAALWLLGSFTRVEAVAGRTSRLEIDSDDCACVLLGRTGGPFATIRLDYVSRRPVRRYTLVGDEASVEWDLRAGTLTLSSADGVESIALGADAYDVALTYPAAMREMLSAVRAQRPTSQPIEQGLRAVAVALAAHHSAAST
jgi:predicted dehydrogenase